MNKKITSNRDWKEIEMLISKAKIIIIITHVFPDPDAIGAMIGFGDILTEKGKKVLMVVDNGVPKRLQFLKKSKDVLSKLPKNLSADLIIALDADDLAVLGKCGSLAFKLDVPKLIIDHHAYNEYYGTHHLIDSNYVSTTAIIVDLLFELKWKISPQCADALLLGILSDTQLFRVGPITAKTFKLVGNLIDLGADYNHLVALIFSTIESGHLHLLGHVLSKSILKNNVFWTWVTPGDFKKFGLKVTTDFFIVDELIKDRNAYVSASFQLLLEDKIKVSLRAVTGFDVGKIADHFGGGGHTLSSGFILSANNINEVTEKIIPFLEIEAARGTPKAL